jgi:transposase
MRKEARIAMTSQECDRVTIIKKVIRNEMTRKQAAKELKLSNRQIRRYLRRFKEEQEQGLIRRPSGGNRAFTTKFKTDIVASVTKNYSDFGPTLAAEKLKERGQQEINHETLRQWMIEAGLWKGKHRKTARIHQSRARRPRYGELIQIDGSPHDWFEGRRPNCCLLVFIDDATSRLMHLRFEETETTLGYFRGISEYVQTYGRPISWYSDKDSVFVSSKPSKIDGLAGRTQFQRAMRSLGVEMIVAHSPQAKGRVERANGTLQDRLIKEMRLLEISEMENANAWLPEFIKKHNTQFAVEASDKADAHRELTMPQKQGLQQILSIQETRKLSKNLEFGYGKEIYRIQRLGTGYSYRHAAVTVCEQLDGKIVVLNKDGKQLEYKVIDKNRYGALAAESKEVNSVLDKVVKQMKEAEETRAKIAA